MKLDIQYFLSSKHAKWLIIGLIALFSILIVVEFSTLFFSSIEDTSTANEVVRGPAKPNTFDSIRKTSLFGIYVADDLNDDNVKKSMLNITLVGILLGNTAEESQVIIRAANGEEKNYRVNDKIPGGVLIKRIMPEVIIVEHDGGLESVSLPKNELIFEPVAKPLKNDQDQEP